MLFGVELSGVQRRRQSVRRRILASAVALVLGAGLAPLRADDGSNPTPPPPPAHKKIRSIFDYDNDPPKKPETGAKPDSAHADPLKPDPLRPDSARPDSAKPGAGTSDSNKPDATKPNSANPDTAKPDSAKPDTTKPDTTKPQPIFIGPEPTPNTPTPNPSAPNTPVPDSSSPGTTTPDSTGPANATAAPAPVMSRRLSIPNAAAQASVDKLIRGIYKPYPPYEPAKKRQVAQDLLDEGMADKQDSATRYVCLDQAAELAAGAGDMQTAFRAMSRLAKLYDIDRLAEGMAVLRKVRYSSMTRGDRVVAVRAALEMLDGLINAGRVSEADQANAMAQAFASGVSDPAIVATVRRHTELLRFMTAQQQQLAVAQQKLKTSPADPKANLMLGKYYALVRGQWSYGLPMIAKGSDAALKAVAAEELTPPKGADAMLSVAGDWWQASAREPTPLLSSRMKSRASFWYEKAMPDLNGLSKAVAQKRIKECPPVRDDDDSGAAAVDNQTDATEGAAIYGDVTTNFPDLLQNVSGARLVKYHNATDFAGGASETPIADSYSGHAREGTSSQILLFGVYEQWEPGTYLVVYRVQAPQAVTDEKVCFLDVCSGGNTVAQYHPKPADMPAGHWVDLPVLLTLNAATKVEYRLWPSGHQIALDRVYIYKLGN